MNNKRGDDGFTLVEVIIALFILTTALLGAAAVTATVINGNTFSNRSTSATSLAQEKMEELMGVPYQTLLSQSECDPSLHDSLYNRCWTVDRGNPADSMATIEVEVTFPWKGRDREVRIVTIRSR